ncbi:MAG: coaE [Firmicutes bacterium]|nr:coaE [Bacillota bacterium]
MKVIGLTGGIASGKSTVSDILKEIGALIIDADKLARQVVEPGQPAWQKIAEWLGPDFLNFDQSIDRKKLGELIFNDSIARQRLEEITHPCIKEVAWQQLSVAAANGNIVAVLDVPLLFETGWDKHTDANWVVWVDNKTQLERLVKRDKLTSVQAKARIASQMSMSEKLRLADVVIDNSNDVESTRRQVVEAWEKLTIAVQDCC